MAWGAVRVKGVTVTVFVMAVQKPKALKSLGHFVAPTGPWGSVRQDGLGGGLGVGPVGVDESAQLVAFGLQRHEAG